MLVSLNFLKKYVDLTGISAEEVADRLTKSGIEVEEITHLASGTNLVIGKIISLENHPDSDHLHVLKVDIGTDILDIVCGAPNVYLGMKVICAKVHAKLPGGTIEPGVIRGVASNGMLCSLKELGVDEKYLTEAQINGIEDLPADAPVGNEDVLGYLGLDDTILDLKLLANRSDCLSVYNVAREVAALFKLPVKPLEINEISNYKEDNFKVGSESKNSLSFNAKLFLNLTVSESPAWLKDALRGCGIRSINNIVDIGNYVMMVTGQPVHMYDLDKLMARELIVKDNLEESVLALDDKEYKLESGDLVVTSNNTPVCIGGVMGLKNVEVTSETKNIVLEVASFYGARVRRTSIRLGLSSDSSQRFIKGININIQQDVLNFAASLINELCKPTKISQNISYDEQNHDQRTLDCSVTYINNRLGSDYTKEEVKETLELLYFKVNFKNDDEFTVIIPDFRIDIETKADLSEEIVRYNGFSRIKDSLPIMETTIGGRCVEDNKIKVITDYLLNSGLNEILTYTLLNEDDNSHFNYLNTAEPYVILNPLTEDHKIVRRNLLTSMLNCVEYNLNHQNRNFGLFEVSNCEAKNLHEVHLSIALVGKEEGQELFNAKNFDFFEMKGLLSNILGLFNVNPSRLKVERINNKEFHPGKSMAVYLDRKLLAVLGELHPYVRNHYGFKKDNVVVLEMNLSVLFNTKTGNNKFQDYSKYPSVSRDYAFLIKKDTEYDTIVKEIRRASSLIKSIKLVDLYSGTNIAEDEVSICINVTLEKLDSSLDANTIAEVDEKIRNILLNRLKANLRG